MRGSPAREFPVEAGTGAPFFWFNHCGFCQITFSVIFRVENVFWGFFALVLLGVTTENTEYTEFHGKKTQNTAVSRLTEYTERIWVLESGGSTCLWRCVREFFAVVDLVGILWYHRMISS